MNLTRLGKNWDFALRNNSVLLATNIFLAIALTVTSVLAFFNRERVVLVPPRLDEKMVVAWNNAGAEYFKAFGVFVATLLGNITPANSKFVADQLSVFIEPKLYAPIRTQVLAYADDPRFARAASFNYFSPTKVVWEPATAKVFVLGTITMSSFNPQISGMYEYRTVVYEFKFVMNDGRPLIVEFNSYPGGEARTLAWIEKNQRVLDKEAKERDKKGGSAITPATALDQQAADNTARDPGKDDPNKEGEPKPVDPAQAVPPTAAPGTAGAPAGSAPTPLPNSGPMPAAGAAPAGLAPPKDPSPAGLAPPKDTSAVSVPKSGLGTAPPPTPSSGLLPQPPTPPSAPAAPALAPPSPSIMPAAPVGARGAPPKNAPQPVSGGR